MASEGDPLQQRERFLFYAQQALTKANFELQQLDKFRAEYQVLNDTLHMLPEKLKHPIMVPLSKVGFMRGELVHTNELLVLLGDNYFVTKSAQATRELVQRRIDCTCFLTLRFEKENR